MSAVYVSTTELASGLNLGLGHLEQERSVNTGRKSSRKNCRIGMTWERVTKTEVEVESSFSTHQRTERPRPLETGMSAP